MALKLWGNPGRSRRSPLLPGDIDALARLVEGVDADRYYDVQAQDAWQEAAGRWPLVAAVLGLKADAQK
ncbi:BcsR/BcsP family cellulose biosynthesis protein [Paraburkholderia bannensis]|uniref:BcsR/BcsP family cellulose biosynthesis protein n=1 Tax=Paraburkholderia bannensis TaxID=765414 RepID=UPI0005AB5072|nr:BcsR/BcsP family cellulose biosynthesis protein [Paraburkholderia bannensis]